MLSRLLWTLPLLCFGLAASPTLAADYATNVRSAQHGMQVADKANGIRKLLPPNAPMPKVGPDASVLDYVEWAGSSLSRGQTAEAELSLQWGELRSRIDEEEAAYEAGQPPPAFDNLCLRAMCQAMRAIGKGEYETGMSFIAAAAIDINERRTAPIQTASR